MPPTVPVTDLMSRWKPGQNGCMEWTGATARGYGYVTYKRQTQPITRVIWTFLHGPIPQDMVVCHSCDNPLCINPGHLFVGTQKENLDDMIKKGRHPTRKKLRVIISPSGRQRCRTCDTEKDIEDFNVRSMDGGRATQCRECAKEYWRVNSKKWPSTHRGKQSHGPRINLLQPKIA